jgi:hypothetical protein
MRRHKANRAPVADPRIDATPLSDTDGDAGPAGAKSVTIPPMTTHDSRPLHPSLQRGISRQSFLRGAVSVLAGGAAFGPIPAGADPGGGWTGLAASIGGSVLLPASGAQFTTAKGVFDSFCDR